MIEEVTSSWKAQGLDLLLTPTFPFPAVPHNLPGRLQRKLYDFQFYEKNCKFNLLRYNGS